MKNKLKNTALLFSCLRVLCVSKGYFLKYICIKINIKTQSFKYKEHSVR